MHAESIQTENQRRISHLSRETFASFAPRLCGCAGICAHARGSHLAACADGFTRRPCVRPAGALGPCAVPPCARAPGGCLRGGGCWRTRADPPQSQVSSQAAADEMGSPRGHRGPAHRCSHSRASWQRQDNMPWGAKPLGSPLKCLM